MTKKKFSISFFIIIINAPFIQGAKQIIISNIWGIGEGLIKHLGRSSDKRNKLNTGQKSRMFGQG